MAGRTAGGESPKAAAIVRNVAAKPRLDGDLADDVWQQAEHLELASPLSDDAEWPGAVMLAYDDEFLYVAIDCRCAPQANYPNETRTRERDADLAVHDRVELRLDIDRDWTTFYRLVVDHRGWTAEDCWGVASWNPRWFVAAAQAKKIGRSKAAIPLSAALDRSGRAKHGLGAWVTADRAGRRLSIVDSPRHRCRHAAGLRLFHL